MARIYPGKYVIMAYDTEDTDCLDLPVDDKAEHRRKDAERKRAARQNAKDWAAKNAVDPMVSMERLDPTAARFRKYPIMTREQQAERHRHAISTLKDANILTRLARRNLPAAFAAHMEIITTSKNDSARVKAIKELYELAVGKAYAGKEAEQKPGANITVNFGRRPKNVVIDADVEDTDDDNDDA